MLEGRAMAGDATPLRARRRVMEYISFYKS
jgi:hypothetical protein